MAIYQNGKEVTPKLNGKNLSRVMYNGKKIWPTAIPSTSNIIYINQLESDPAKMISGDVNGDIIQWIRNNSHRVLAKKTGEGTMTYAVLDDNNSTLYSNGTAADLTGAEGDVFVKLPTFYYAGNDDGGGASGDNVEITFSKEPFENSIEWDTNILIGAYEAYYGGNKLQSISGVESSSKILQADFKQYARNRGTGYQIVDRQMHCVLGCLFYAMYGNTDSQVICGAGTDDFSKVTGQTNTLGMNDTVAWGNGKSGSINFWGLENWWGNKYGWLEDYENAGGTLVATVNDPVNGGARQLDIPSMGYTGYPKKMKFGRYLDLVATDDDPKNESDSVGYCGYQWWPGKTSLYSRVVVRSNSDLHTYGGVAFANASFTSSDKGLYVSSRLAFRGICTEETNVSTFKALPVL